MEIVRQANAIVYFRMLRSVGHFRPVAGSSNFVFYPCTCRSPRTESLPNGLPEPILGEKLNNIVKEFCHEFGALCRSHFR